MLLQTHQPDAPVIAALVQGDSEGFYEAEIAARRAAAMPPFGRLAGIIISGESESDVAATARALARAAPDDVADFFVLGPAPAPLAQLRGRFRHRLLVHAGRQLALQPLLRTWLAKVTVPNGVRVAVDIDPYSFF